MPRTRGTSFETCKFSTERPLAVLPDLEVPRLEIAHGLAIAVDRQYLELDQLNVDLAAVLGSLEEFGILLFPTVGESRDDPDEVTGVDVLDQRVDTDRVCSLPLPSPVPIVERRDQTFAAVDLDAGQDRGPRHGDPGRDADGGRTFRSNRTELCNPDREGRVEVIQHHPVGADPGSVVAVRADFNRLLAGWIAESVAGLERWLPRLLDRLAVVQELDRRDQGVDDQGLDLDLAGQELAVPASRRHDADRRRFCCRQPLDLDRAGRSWPGFRVVVDGAEVQVRNRDVPQLGYVHQPVARSVVRLDP